MKYTFLVARCARSQNLSLRILIFVYWWYFSLLRPVYCAVISYVHLRVWLYIYIPYRYSRLSLKISFGIVVVMTDDHVIKIIVNTFGPKSANCYFFADGLYCFRISFRADRIIILYNKCTVIIILLLQDRYFHLFKPENDRIEII